MPHSPIDYNKNHGLYLGPLWQIVQHLSQFHLPWEQIQPQLDLYLRNHLNCPLPTDPAIVPAFDRLDGDALKEALREFNQQQEPTLLPPHLAQLPPKNHYRSNLANIVRPILMSMHITNAQQINTKVPIVKGWEGFLNEI